MNALSPIRTATVAIALAVFALGIATTHGPSAHAQSSDAAVREAVRTAHTEALESLRTGSTRPLRSYTPYAAAQIAEQLNAYRDYGVVVIGASEPSFGGVRVSGGSASVITRTSLQVSYFGLFSDVITADITWHLAYQNGRWVVDAAEITL
jgi:hypothetical protein